MAGFPMNNLTQTRRRNRLGALLVVLILVAMREAPAKAQEVPPSQGTATAEKSKSGDLEGILNLDLEQLSKVEVRPAAMSMEVTSVERRESTVGRTPAAVYVVTQEMIRRSGVRNVPEVLRTVPGVEVARINASAWAISIRGLNTRFANKLLVQIDGVAIYSPTHSGVFWEREYVILEDVERIEVIRGPGASVWGVNAVNGVINIVTKASKDTKGVYIDGGGGDDHGHRDFGDARVGGQSGDWHWRVYGMTMQDGMGYAKPPAVAFDNPSANQGGFRADWTPTRQDTFTIQGDFYDGIDRQWGTYTPPIGSPQQMDCSMARTLTRWTRKLDEDTDWSLQLYYYNPYGIGPNRNTVANFDMDFQYHFKRDIHDIVCGCGYRNNSEEWIYGPNTIVAEDSEQIPSYFVQDTITLVEDRWFLTLGSKLITTALRSSNSSPPSEFSGRRIRRRRFGRRSVAPLARRRSTNGYARHPTPRISWPMRRASDSATEPVLLGLGAVRESLYRPAGESAYGQLLCECRLGADVRVRVERKFHREPALAHDGRLFADTSILPVSNRLYARGSRGNDAAQPVLPSVGLGSWRQRYAGLDVAIRRFACYRRAQLLCRRRSLRLAADKTPRTLGGWSEPVCRQAL